MTPDTRYSLAIARALHKPATSYQRAMLELCNAPSPSGYANEVVVVLMPRQCGKTTTVLTLALGRGAHRRDYRAMYTAQRGTVVTERFTGDGDGWISQLQSGPLDGSYRYSRRAAAERITHLRTRSFLRGFPPVAGALRSLALDLVVVDEAQEHDEARGKDLDATIMPTFTTRPMRQLLVTGTAGGPGWWRTYYDRAKAGKHALLEVGTWPDGADPADESVWREHHPGLRAGLTDVGALRSALDVLGEAAFAREYGNRWDEHAQADQPVPLEQWDTCTPAPGGTPVAVAFDVTPDRRHATVVGVTDRDHLTIRWAGPVEQLAQQLPEDLPAYCLPGQTGTAADLRAAGRTVHVLSAAQYRTACQQLHDATVDHTLHHAAQSELREAWTLAARSWHGDTWVLSARRSGGDITPAVAAVIAWGATRHADALIM